MKKYAVRKLVLLSVVAALGAGASATVMASDNHAKTPNSRLKGNYGFQAQGYFGANFDAATLQTTGAVAERVGVYTFDGKGNCKIHSIANKAGLGDAVIQDTAEGECSYTVN